MNDDWLTRYDALAAEAAARAAWARTPGNEKLSSGGALDWGQVKQRAPELAAALDDQSRPPAALRRAWEDSPSQDVVRDLFPVIARALDRLAGRLRDLRLAPTPEETYSAVEVAAKSELLDLGIETREARAAATRIAGAATRTLRIG